MAGAIDAASTAFDYTRSTAKCRYSAELDLRLRGHCDDLPEADLKHSIELQHGGIATLAPPVPVKETLDRQTVWEGVVHVFDLEGHPKAERAGAVLSPADAVRASIVAEHRA